LREAGLHNDFQRIARSEGEDLRITDKTGKLYLEEVDSEGHNRPEVDRIQLRRLLLNSLPETAIQWGSKVRSMSAASDNKYEVHVETSRGRQSKVFDLIVGADGAWSKVRPLLSDTKPHYSTVPTLDCRIRQVDTLHPHISTLVGKGSYFACSPHKGIIAQRNGDGSIHIYVMLQTSEIWLQDVGIDWTDVAKAKELLLDEYKDWGEELKDLIRYSDPDIVPRPLYMLPLDFQWTSKPGITLLGDAAHLMTPMAGEGVNLAMLDGLELSRTIIGSTANSGNSLFAAVGEYEERMFERSQEKMRETWDNLELFFGKEAPREFVDTFERRMREHGGPPGGLEGSGAPNPQA